MSAKEQKSHRSPAEVLLKNQYMSAGSKHKDTDTRRKNFVDQQN